MKWSSERKQEVRDAWDEGLSVTLIAERLDDKQVVRCRVAKVYSEKPRLRVEVRAAE
jgi:hypothetical protein